LQLSRLLRQFMTAVRTLPCSREDRTAIPTSDRLPRLALPDLRPMAILYPLVSVELPVDRLLDESKLVDHSTVVDHQRVLLARSRTQHSADCLEAAHQRLRRPRNDRARNARLIPSERQHVDVADDASLAGLHLAQDLVALVGRQLAVDHVGRDAGLNELVPQVDGVRDRRREYDRLPVARDRKS